MPLLEVDQVNKRYDRVIAVDNVSFEARPSSETAPEPKYRRITTWPQSRSR